MEITGRIIERGGTQVISDRFSKREIVIETEGNEEGKYKQQIPIEFINKSIEKTDGFPVGSQVTVSIEIRGRKWEKPDGTHKYFVSISGWRISSANAGGDSYPTQGQQGGGGGGGRPPAGGFSGPSAGGDDDDIPF